MDPEQFRRSADRKVAALLRVDKAGKSHVVVRNTHGFPAGLSCPGRTEACAGVTASLPTGELQLMATRAQDAAGKRGRETTWRVILPQYGLPADFPCYVVEDLRRGTEENAAYANWEMIRTQLGDSSRVEQLVGNTLDAFVRDSESAGVELIYRFHWDGDIPSVEVAVGIAAALRSRPQVHAWLYTRSLFAVSVLAAVPNLSVYLSADRDNVKDVAETLVQFPRLNVAVLGVDAAEAAKLLGELGRPAAPVCPVDAGKLPVVTAAGRVSTPEPGGDAVGACALCRLCIEGRGDVRFTINKKKFQDEGTRRRLATRVVYANDQAGRDALFARRDGRLADWFDQVDGDARTLGFSRAFRKHYVSYRDGCGVALCITPRGARLLATYDVDPSSVTLGPRLRDISQIGHLCPGKVELTIDHDEMLAVALSLLQDMASAR